MGLSQNRLALDIGVHPRRINEVGEEGLDLRGAHVFGMAFVVEEDEALDPIHIGLFGAIRVVFAADGITDLVKELVGRRSVGRALTDS